MARAASSTGKMAPVSLFTSMQLTKMVFWSMAAASASGGRWPELSGFTYTTSKPSFSNSRQGFNTESCSAAVVTILFPRRLRAWAAPKRARLLASVPPLVKVISSAWAPSRWATKARASSTRCRARKPRVCREDGLPYSSTISSRARSATGRSTWVVALLSR